MCLDLMSTKSLRVAHLSTVIDGGLDLETTRTSTRNSLAEEKISREKIIIVSLIDQPLIETSHQREITLAIRAIERLIEPEVAMLAFH
jgi:hypothetical protein